MGNVVPSETPGRERGKGDFRVRGMLVNGTWKNEFCLNSVID